MPPSGGVGPWTAMGTVDGISVVLAVPLQVAVPVAATVWSSRLIAPEYRMDRYRFSLAISCSGGTLVYD